MAVSIQPFALQNNLFSVFKLKVFLSFYSNNIYFIYFNILGVSSFIVILFILYGILAVFWLAKSFNRDLSKWNTGVVTSMKRSEYMFRCE